MRDIYEKEFENIHRMTLEKPPMDVNQNLDGHIYLIK